jgi:hypothetical protein
VGSWQAVVASAAADGGRTIDAAVHAPRHSTREPMRHSRFSLMLVVPGLSLGFASLGQLADALAARAGLAGGVRCQIVNGRVRIVFRNAGLTDIPPERRMAIALDVAALARERLAAGYARSFMRFAGRAVVVVYEDVRLVSGCNVSAEWTCVVPSGVG